MVPGRSRPASWLAAAGAAALLAACGGGGGGDGGDTGAAAGCSIAEQNDWLAGYMNDWYFWTQLAPKPAAAGYATVDAYFNARKYTGIDPAFPADRWSNIVPTAVFTRTFTDGQTLGWGIAVNGVEVDGDTSRPLFVRYVDPGSPAALQGVRRGDELLSANGRSAASMIGAGNGGDFSPLGATEAGQQLALKLRRDGAELTLNLSAAIYALAPVPRAEVQSSPLGRRVGVLQVQQMVSQALTPLDQAFANFRSQGIEDLVLDLRYNGGGLVSVGGTLASYIAGARVPGEVYAALRYNAAHTAGNVSTVFSAPGNGLSMPRVFVLAGPRTCSASEQVINGLIGAGVQVVQVGGATCGKPVGFNPVDHCGSTYSVVTFESVNRLGAGRYFDGLAATCEAAEDFSVAQDGSTDPLLAAAMQYADRGACPRAAPTAVPSRARARRPIEPGQLDVMLAR